MLPRVTSTRQLLEKKRNSLDNCRKPSFESDCTDDSESGYEKIPGTIDDAPSTGQVWRAVPTVLGFRSGKMCLSVFP